MSVVFLAPENIAGFKKQLLAVLAALLAGLIAYYMTGGLGIRHSWIKASGGFGAFALMLFVWPRLLPPHGSDLYRIRVTVLGPDNRPVEGAEVMASVGGEKKKVDMGWELNIPASALPADRRLTLYAEKFSAFASGRVDMTLGEDLQPSIFIKLQEDRSAGIHGRVLDAAGDSIKEARVNVVGHENEVMLTGPEGEFSLAAHAAPGQIVRLRAEKKGFRTTEQGHPAGPAPATLVLER